MRFTNQEEAVGTLMDRHGLTAFTAFAPPPRLATLNSVTSSSPSSTPAKSLGAVGTG
ncbi:hypothetical protein AB0A74_00250 [Saccharothrix sp. NPDC042600]|uniref:hypothetical protein n=1 Tax=Saccharothrix TaxID=2071 RepID=UPI0033EF371A